MNRLTKKEKGFVRDIVKGATGTKAALNNYDTVSENTAAVIASDNLRKPKIQEAIKVYADRIPDDLLEKVQKEGLQANKIISANITYGDADEKTNDFIEVPDHAVRHKFFDSSVKIKGYFAPEKNININMNIKSIDPTDETILNSLKIIQEKLENE